VAIIQDGMKLIPDTWRLKYVFAYGGNQELSNSVVKLERGNTVGIDSAFGDGPVDASYKAIDRITGFEGRLLEYSVSSVTRGKDALGEVFVHVEFNGRPYTGKAASVDIIDASARAYLNAVNKAVYEQKRGEERTTTTSSGTLQV